MNGFNRKVGACACVVVLSAGTLCRAESLWELANKSKELLRISTLFTAHNVRDHLATDDGIEEAMGWCKKTGVTHVFIESYRSRYTAERQHLEVAKARFAAAGFDVSGCVTTTQIGKISTNWKAWMPMADK